MVLLICTVSTCLAAVAGLSWLGLQTADEVEVKWDIPVEVQGGTKIEFGVAITNITAEPITLESIDMSMDYLFGIAIDSTDPPFIESYQFSWLGETFQTYSFGQHITPGETVTVVFHGRAVKSGDYNGMMTVCINNFFNCRDNVARTIVK